MKKFIDAVAGDGKNVTPARKNTAYALIITAIAFALALIILIVSSVMFAVADKDNGNSVNNDAADAGGDAGGAVISSSNLQYTTVSADELSAKVDKLVDFTERKDREIEAGTNKLYYAKSADVKSLSSGAMSALDSMLKDFYNANKDKINADIGANSDNSECDIPLVIEANEAGTSFKLVVFGNDATTFNDTKYTWIYNNAYKYGFINSENTFTYVSAAISTQMKTKSVATLEALVKALGGKNASVSVPSTTGAGKATTYQMYYLAKDAELKVPTNYEYSVIANGTDGYFVVIDMSKKVQAQSSTDGGVG